MVWDRPPVANLISIILVLGPSCSYQITIYLAKPTNPAHPRWFHALPFHSVCSRKDIPCGRGRTFLMVEERHSLCSKKDIPCGRRKTFLVFEEGHSVCSMKYIPCVRRKTFVVLRNGSKCRTDLKIWWIWNKIHRATWLWRPKKSSSSQICRKSWKTEKKNPKIFEIS